MIPEEMAFKLIAKTRQEEEENMMEEWSMARIDSEMRRSLVGLKNQEKQRAGQCDIASEQG